MFGGWQRHRHDRGISSIGRVRRSQRRGSGIETRILQCFFIFTVGEKFIFYGVYKIRSASMAQLAERSAVNRQVLGSIPSGGVFFFSLKNTK